MISSATMTWIIPALLGIAALLYSTVGHAGGSGFLAVMALTGVAPVIMKPAALALNVCSALVATIRWVRSGCFSWRLFWPFALASVPLAFVGGALPVSSAIFKLTVGAFLLVSALWVGSSRERLAAEELLDRPLFAALLIGAAIGFVSGAIGIGGGIFLSPIVLFMRWGNVRTTSGVSAAFILVNSISALAGNMKAMPSLPVQIVPWAIAAIIGSAIGSYLGTRVFRPRVLRVLLAVVLVIAGVKLIATAAS